MYSSDEDSHRHYGAMDDVDDNNELASDPDNDNGIDISPTATNCFKATTITFIVLDSLAMAAAICGLIYVGCFSEDTDENIAQDMMKLIGGLIGTVVLLALLIAFYRMPKDIRNNCLTLNGLLQCCETKDNSTMGPDEENPSISSIQGRRRRGDRGNTSRVHSRGSIRDASVDFLGAVQHIDNPRRYQRARTPSGERRAGEEFLQRGHRARGRRRRHAPGRLQAANRQPLLAAGKEEDVAGLQPYGRSGRGRRRRGVRRLPAAGAGGASDAITSADGSVGVAEPVSRGSSRNSRNSVDSQTHRRRRGHGRGPLLTAAAAAAMSSDDAAVSRTQRRRRKGRDISRRTDPDGGGGYEADSGSSESDGLDAGRPRARVNRHSARTTGRVAVGQQQQLESMEDMLKPQGRRERTKKQVGRARSRSHRGNVLRRPASRGPGGDAKSSDDPFHKNFRAW